MGYSERMEVVNGCGYLMCYCAGSIFGYLEVLGFEIVEEIAALEILHDDIDEVRILKHVIKPDYIWVLADFEHFNFSF